MQRIMITQTIQKTLSWLLIAALIFSSLVVWRSSVGAAAQTKLYITPATKTIEVGKKFFLLLRLNTGGEQVNGVDTVVNFDKSKMSLVSVNTTTGDFSDVIPVNNSGNGQIEFVGASFSPVNKTNAIVYKATFKAKAGSGSADVTISQDSIATSATTSENVLSSVQYGKVVFTSPAQPAPAPTPKPKPTPTTPGDTDDSPTQEAPTTTNPDRPSDTSNIPKNGTKTSNRAPKQRVNRVKRVGFKRAIIQLQTDKPASATIQYGLDSDQLGLSVNSSGLKTTHDLSIDSQTLEPGRTYFYRTVSIDASGEKTVGELKSFVTRGYKISVEILDDQNQPIKNLPVTLNSETRNATTNNNGVAVFTDIAPGQHAISFEHDSRRHVNQIEVSDTLGLTDGKNVADNQNVPLQSYSIVAEFTVFTTRNVAIAATTFVVVFLSALTYVVAHKRTQLANDPYRHNQIRVPSPSAPKLGDSKEDIVNQIAVEPNPSAGEVINPNKKG